MTTMQQITAEVAEAHGLPVKELYGTSRGAPVSRARQRAWRLIQERLGSSYPAIARHFDRDHTTILWGVRRDREANPNPDAATMRFVVERLAAPAIRAAESYGLTRKDVAAIIAGEWGK